MKPGRWTRLKWVLAGGIAAFILLGVTAWLAFQHIPAWYQPAFVPPERLDYVRNETINHRDRFSYALSATDKPFQFSLTKEQINNAVAVGEKIWPLSREWLPSYLSNPCIVLERGAIRLAATYRSGSLATIASVRLLVEGRRDGLWIKLDSIELGSLPIPISTVKDALRQMDATTWPANQGSKYLRLGESIPPLTDMLKERGMRLPNAWVWDNPKRSFWAYALEVEPDAIVAHVEPLSP